MAYRTAVVKRTTVQFITWVCYRPPA